MSEDTNPLVGYIMSVYCADNSNALNESLDSIYKQDYSNFSVYIMVDGAIPDELNKVLIYYKSKYDNLNLFYREKNMGLAHSLNNLIDICLNDSVEFIARMDSDDICLSQRISTQVNFMLQHPNLDILGAACEEFGSDFAKAYKCPPLNHDDIMNRIVITCPFVHPTVMFRKRVFIDGIRYPEDTKLTEDMALWLTLAEKGFIFGNIPDVLIRYRIVEATLKRRQGLRKALDESKIRLRYLYDNHRRFETRYLLKSVIHATLLFFIRIIPTKASSFFYKFFR
ncbi:glycosyltransferase [Motilimonas cestriensis]|uniref:glycosyltransferase n=1 Tax=Motilimonas cestriensis TaxID=2742685 RepID=UPI003DA5C50C